MKYVDLVHFLETGNKVGQAVDLMLGGSLKGEFSPMNRRSSRSDLGLPAGGLKATPSTEEVIGRAEKSPTAKK